MSYSEKVAILLMHHYGLTLDDCTDQPELDECESAGQQPFDVVNGIAEKYDLSFINESAFFPSGPILAENT